MITLTFSLRDGCSILWTQNLGQLAGSVDKRLHGEAGKNDDISIEYGVVSMQLPNTELSHPTKINQGIHVYSGVLLKSSHKPCH